MADVEVLEQRIKALQEDAKRAKKEAAAQLQAKCDQYEQKLAELATQEESAGSAAQDKIAATEAENQKKIKAMEKKVKNAELANKKTQDAVSELGSAISTAAKSAPAMLRAAKESLDTKQVRITELEGTVEQLRKEHATYKEFYDGLDATTQALEEEKAASAGLRDEVAENQKTINELEGSVAALTTEVKQSVAAMDTSEYARQTVADQLDKTVQDDQATRKNLEAQISDLTATIASLNTDLEDAKAVQEKSNADYSENISKARAELSEKLAAETARANSAEATITQAKTQAEEQKARLEKTIAEHELAIQAGETKQKELQDIISGKSRDGDDIHAQFDRAQVKITDLNATVEVQTGKIEELTRTKKAVEEKLQSESTRLTNEVKELTNSVSALTGTVDSKTAEVDQLNKDIARLRSDLDAKTTEFSDLKIANEGVVAERDALNKQVDKSKQEFTKQIELLTKTHADSQAQLTTEHKAKVSQMEASMKSAGEDSDKQLADMVQQRKKEETKSASLQQELVKAQQRDAENADTVLSLKQDLQKATHMLTKNSAQFAQLSSDLEASERLNEQLKKDLELQKQSWDADIEQMTKKQDELSASIKKLEATIAEKMEEISAGRQENVKIEKEAADARLSETEAKAIVVERDGTITSMKEAAAAAEKLREELRAQHQADLESGKAEREALAVKVESLTKDLEEAQQQADTLRQDLLKSRQDFSEEQVTRESRDTEITALKQEVARQNESLEKKDQALAEAEKKATDDLDRAKKELLASQASVQQFQDDLATAANEMAEAMSDISAWKARESVAHGKADEGWAKVESEKTRANDCDEAKEAATEALMTLMADWKSDVAKKEAEKEELMAKEAKLMGELEQVRTKMQEESNARAKAESAAATAQAELTQATESLGENSERLQSLEQECADQGVALADVTSNLEKTTQESGERIASLQASVESLTAELTDAKKSLTETTGAKEVADQDRTKAESLKDSAETAKTQAEAHRDECVQNMEDARKELAAKTQELVDFTKDAQATQQKLEAELEAAKNDDTHHVGDIGVLQTKFNDLQKEHKETSAANESGTQKIKELEGWKADAQVQQEAAAKQLEDTKAQLAKEIADVRAEQASAQASMEVMQTKLSEAEAKAAAADKEAKAANDDRKKAVEDLKAAVADGETKAAKLEKLTGELTARTEAEKQAQEAKKEARSAASSLNDEVGLLRAQLTAASRKETATAAALSETAAKLKMMEALNGENSQIMGDMTKAYKGEKEANAELKGVLNKLLDVAQKAEAEAKAARDAVKSGQRAPPVLSKMRQEASELNETIQGAATTFDPEAGVFDLADLKAVVERGSVGISTGGDLPDMPDAGNFKVMEGTLEKAGGRGAKKAYKKRHFKLKQDSLQFAASAKVDAKVLGVVSLDGASVKVDGVDIVVTDGQGRENELRAKTAAEAKKWSEAIQSNCEALGE